MTDTTAYRRPELSIGQSGAAEFSHPAAGRTTSGETAP